MLDEGINFIDTSIDYGRSEELIGKFIAHRRSEYVLASKCGCVPGAGMGTEHVHTAENIRAGVEHSLRTMKTDHLDLVQFHRSLSREEFEAEGALAEALDLRDEGKVRFVGVSGRAARRSTSRSTWACSTPSRSRTRRCSATTRT